jgi:hypothetical protein
MGGYIAHILGDGKQPQLQTQIKKHEIINCFLYHFFLIFINCWCEHPNAFFIGNFKLKVLI